MSSAKNNKPLEIKISTVVAVNAVLRSLNNGALEEALKHLTGGTPDYFENEPTVLDFVDCDAATSAPDFAVLISVFKQHRLNVVAIRNAPAQWSERIAEHGLAIDTVAPSRANAPVEVEAPPEKTAPRPTPASSLTSQPSPAPETLFVDTPVRAGQRIYARGADLVVTAIVNAGAELIADGSIHVYAPLRGRALAGASGNANARIFALSMEAELVSIAGMYKTFENGIPADCAKKPAQVRLAGDRIDVSSIRI